MVRPSGDPDTTSGTRGGGLAARGSRCALAASLLLLACTSCSVKRFVVNQVGNAIAQGNDVFTSDDDPELVRDAIPFGLKTTEMLLRESPRHRGLLLAACQGFTQYSYAFVQMEADYGGGDYETRLATRERALRLYLRARGYGLRGLELRRRGVTAELSLAPEQAVQAFGAREQPMLFWTAVAWGAAITLGKDRPGLVADVPAVKALMQRALALDENYERGAIHEAMIALEALPPAMGGSVERARRHFERALAVSKGEKPGPYVMFAETVDVMQQNRKEFETLLRQALAIDPDRHPASRLESLMMQRRARALLGKADELFIDSADEGEGGSR